MGLIPDFMTLPPGLLAGLGQDILDPVAPGARRKGTDRHQRGNALLLCHHCFIMDVPGHADALIITDAAVNIAPKLRVPNTMKYTLRCHDFGWARVACVRASGLMSSCKVRGSQNRASPQGVAATIATSFVARFANTASIGCTSLRASDDSDSQRTRISLC